MNINFIKLKKYFLKDLQMLLREKLYFIKDLIPEYGNRK